MRYETTRAFQTFPQRAERLDLGCSDGETVLLALLEAIIERLADIMEAAGRGDRDAVARDLPPGYGPREPVAGLSRRCCRASARQGDVLSHVLASLVTLERLIAFLGAVGGQRDPSKEVRVRIKSVARDIRFLAEHADFLSQKVTFLLDATLGMISIQQNAIIKIFSVAAVIFLPPTLVASIYGMNFEVMPELTGCSAIRSRSA